MRLVAYEHEPGDAGSVTASEFSFLALGLVLGLVSGAALIEFLRARPPSTPQVKVTVSPDSVATSPGSTLADAFVGSVPSPPEAAPRTDESPRQDAARPAMTAERPFQSRTRNGRPRPADRPTRPGGTSSTGQRRRKGRPPGPRRGVRVAGRPRCGGGLAVDPSEGRGAPVPRSHGVARDRPRARPPQDRDPPSTARRTTTSTRSPSTGPCAEERRIADERCEVASRARARARCRRRRAPRRAADLRRATSRPPRRPRRSPTHARSRPRRRRPRPRSARRPPRQRTTEDHEAAARAWLNEIDRINRDAR